jgi:hypothetical protein
MKSAAFLVLSGLALAGCSSDCGKPVYRSPCDPAPVELQAATPDRCGLPVYTAPHCLPTEGIRNLIDKAHQTVFGCPAPKKAE